jgi:putative transcriptional regulator
LTRFLLHDPDMEAVIAPGFLVAAPHLKDPNFDSTVVFMVEHDDEEGSLGLVINRESEMTLERVLVQMKLAVPTEGIANGDHRVHYGGPVSPELGWIVHTPDWRGQGTRLVGDAVAVSASLEVLRAIASGEGPREFLFCLGYAGWGPGQLVEEIKTGSWFNVPFESELIFEVEVEQRWRTAIERLGIDPMALAPMVGDA